MNSIINEYEHRIEENDDASNMFLNVINEFRYDFFPDGFWSVFPNIWKENINGIDEYISKININLKPQFRSHLHEFEITLK